jgi:hypothetical protein
MLIDYNKEIDKLNEVRLGNVKEGLALGHREIDEWFRFKPSNFNVILGAANVGKTTTVLYLMLLYTIKHKLKWIIYSSENEPHGLIRKLVEFLEGKPINKIDTESFKKWVKWVYKYFYFIDTNRLYNYRDLLKVAQRIHDEVEANGFFIDPYNSLTKDKILLKGIGAHEYDYQATSEMRLFCKDNNISIWLNCHSVTEAQRMKHGQDHLYGGHPMPPMASHAEGGSKFINRCDDFLVCHRYTSHPTDWMVSKIYVKKVKDIDTGGRPTVIDEPINLKSIKNNVGFEVNGFNLINLKVPF